MEYRSDAWTAGSRAGAAAGLMIGVTFAVREQLKNYKVWKSMGSPGKVAVSVEGHPGTVCILPFSFALAMMRQQKRDVDLSTANSLRVTVSKRVAESMGTKVRTREPTKEERKKAMTISLDQKTSDMRQDMLELASIRAAMDSGRAA